MAVGIVNEKESIGPGGQLNAEDKEEEKYMMLSFWLRCLENRIFQVRGGFGKVGKICRGNLLTSLL